MNYERDPLYQHPLGSELAPIKFSNGITIQLIGNNNCFCGLGNIKLGELALRSGRLGILPYIETPDGFLASSYIIAGIETINGAVVINLNPCWTTMGFMRWMQHAYHFRANTADWFGKAQHDPNTLIQLIIKPHQEDVGGIKFDGFSYAFTYRTDSKRIHTIVDRASWELGGNASGNIVYQRLTTAAPVVELKYSEHYFSGWTLPGIRNPFIFSFLPLYTQMQGFTFQCDNYGILITLHERPMYIRTLLEKRRESEDFLHFNQFGFDLTSEIALPARKILYARRAKSSDRADRDNDYLSIREDVAERVHRYYGVKREWAQPYGEFFTWDSNPRVENFLTHGVNAIAKTGVKDIFLLTMWETDMSAQLQPPGNCCCILDFEIARRFGGEEFFKKLTNAIHAKGMRAGMWTGQCFSARSPYVSKHSDWFVFDQSGQIDRDHYGYAQAVFDESNPEFRAWFLQRLRYAREKLGLDGLYRDSHFNQGSDKFSWKASTIVNTGKGATLDNIDALKQSASYCEPIGTITTVHDAEITFQRECQEMGYYYAVESSGVFGISWGGMRLDISVGNEHIYSNFTKTLPVKEIKELGLNPIEVFFRGLANRICYGPHFEPNIGKHGTLLGGWEGEPIENYAGLAEAMAKYNNIYSKVEPEMKILHVLPCCKGTIWTNPETTTKIVWVYEDCDIVLDPKEKVTAYTEKAKVINGVVKAKKMGVYRIYRG